MGRRGAAPSCSPKAKRNFGLPKNLTANNLLLTEALPIHKQSRNTCFFVPSCFLSTVDTQRYISFKRTPRRFSKSLCSAVLTRVAAIHRRGLSQCHWVYSLCCALYSRHIHSVAGNLYLPLRLAHFAHGPHPSPLATTSLLPVLRGLILLLRNTFVCVLCLIYSILRIMAHFIFSSFFFFWYF